MTERDPTCRQTRSPPQLKALSPGNDNKGSAPPGIRGECRCMSRLTYEEGSLPAQARCVSTVKIGVVKGQKTVHSAHIIFPAKDAPKVKREQKSMKHVEFSPSRHRKDIVMVSKLRKYIGNPSLTSKSG